MFLIMWFVIPALAPASSFPEINVQSVTPCQIKNGNIIPIESFMAHASQLMCGKVSTNESPIYLTLLITNSENSVGRPEYIDEQQVENSTIYFELDPPLPAGRYNATIMYARRTLAEFYFEVEEE